jgi:hypothetical protein
VDGGVTGEPLERPRQRGGRAVVTSHQQRDELVAHVAVGRGVAGLVALFEKQVQDGVADRLGPPARHRLQQQGVKALDRQPKAPPGAARPEVAPHERHREHPGQRTDVVERGLDRVAQGGDLPLAASAEDHAQDDLQRQPSHALQRRDPTTPRAQLPARELGDHRRKGAHALPVKRSLHQPPLPQMRLAVEQQDGVRPGERAQELPTLTSRRDRRIQAEDLANGIGVREQHHRLLGPVGPDRHRVAEALVDATQKCARPRHPRHGLPGGRRARTPGQIHGLSLRPTRPHPTPRGRATPRAVALLANSDSAGTEPPGRSSDEPPGRSSGDRTEPSALRGRASPLPRGTGTSRTHVRPGRLRYRHAAGRPGCGGLVPARPRCAAARGTVLPYCTIGSR